MNGRLDSEDGDEEREGEHRPVPRPSTVGEQQAGDEQQPEPDPKRGQAMRESVRVRVRHMALSALRTSRMAVKRRRGPRDLERLVARLRSG